MNNIIKSIFLMMLTCQFVSADTVTLPTTYQNGSTVTASNLNSNFTAITAQINGGLDNNNANTTGGYRFFEIKSSLPSNGSQGRVVFNTADNTLNLDNGAAWLATITPSGTLATGKIPYYNGGWSLLTPGTQYYSLISNGASSLPSYQQVSLTQGVSGTLPIASGGTGQVTAQAAVDALLPNQSGNSGKFLTTNGSASSWGSSAMQLISTTTVSSATTSGDIVISPLKTYKVVANITGGGSNAVSFNLLFNNDTGSNYRYVFRGFDDTASANNGNNSAGTTLIALGGSDYDISTADYSTNIEIQIEAQSSTGQKHKKVSGKIIGNITSAMHFRYSDFNGSWSNSADSTSFRLNCSSTFSGKIYLYEVSQS